MKIELYNADCLEKLKDIPNKSVALILTDPPYGINNARIKNGERIEGDNGFEVMMNLDDIFQEYRRILNDTGAIYIFTRFDVMPYWWMKCKRYFKMKNCIAWDKGGGGVGGRDNYINDYEMIMFMTKGKHILNGKREGTVWNFPKVPLGYHPTQKPQKLMEHILEKSSNENDTILDPFMGSGTTGVACKKLNRNFIGIELDEQYFKTAQERINNTL